jgi:hypothetical protein
MRALVLFLALAGVAVAAEPPPPTLRELELEKSLVEAQMQIFIERLTTNPEFKKLQERLKELSAELEKRSPKKEVK